MILKGPKAIIMKSYTKFIMCIFLLSVISCDKEKIIPIEQRLLNKYILNLEFEGTIPIDEKINITINETKNDVQFIYDGRIERRGGYSIQFPKHSYEIDLGADIAIVDLPKDDDWILNANYIDKTFLRHVLSYELFSLMNDINVASKCQYIELELNGVYNGLYVMKEKLDKSSLKINGSDSLAMIFKEPLIFRESYDNISPQDWSNFHQQIYPKIEIEDKTDYIEGVRDFILTSNDLVFENDFSKIFDLENIIDWHLLLLISNNGDGILKNFYLYKVDNETPIRISPWDYDHSFGRDGDNELNLDERPLTMERSILFRRLLAFDWYKTNLKERWEELNHANILSADGLKQRIQIKSAQISESVAKNFELWSVDDQWYYDDNNFIDEINIMINFIDLRHSRLENYFNNL